MSVNLCLEVILIPIFCKKGMLYFRKVHFDYVLLVSIIIIIGYFVLKFDNTLQRKFRI